MKHTSAHGDRQEPASLAGRNGVAEFAIVCLVLSMLTVVTTWPLTARIGSVARIDNADGEKGIWNVAWVARALILDPLHVFDANIFYPHKGTLAYSEANLGAGFLAIPVYWMSGNPYAANNFVLLLSFVLNGAGMYYLARYLSGSRQAALIAAISFAYCPYIFGHLPHVHLLMTAGLPLGLLAFHRIADRPTAARGCGLGLVMAVQAYFCGYYAVFLMLIVGYGVCFMAAWRRLWNNRSYWAAVALAAAVALVLALPVLLPYLAHQRGTGFGRSLQEAQMFAADWRTYFASAAVAHRWLLRLIGHWGELLFPGFIALLFGVAGWFVGWFAGNRWRETAVLYGTLGVLAGWTSLGPDAGLYRVLYSTVPAFTFLRASGRFGLLVVLCLTALASLATAAMLARTARASVVGALLLFAVVAELFVPVRFPPVPPLTGAYRMLASLPDGPLIELPVYSRSVAFLRSRYMLNSTAHWKPLVNAYSDFTPPEFTTRMDALSQFPSLDAFRTMKPMSVRYAMFHLEDYGPYREAVEGRLKEFASSLRPLYSDPQTRLYEIVGYPEPQRVSRPRGTRTSRQRRTQSSSRLRRFGVRRSMTD